MKKVFSSVYNECNKNPRILAEAAQVEILDHFAKGHQKTITTDFRHKTIRPNKLFG